MDATPNSFVMRKAMSVSFSSLILLYFTDWKYEPEQGNNSNRVCSMAERK